jgi:hypothetical protein
VLHPTAAGSRSDGVPVMLLAVVAIVLGGVALVLRRKTGGENAT